MLIRKQFDRRRILRGVLQGSAITVGLPFLECFLNNSGTALANGTPLPVRFGRWFWALGTNEPVWIPNKVGADYDLTPELAPIASVKQHVNIFSRYQVDTAGVNLAHYSGWVTLACGAAPKVSGDLPRESIDVTIGDAIGGGSRYSSLDATATGEATAGRSFRGPGALSPPVTSAVDLYARVFGPDFQDPNSPEFKPNPITMLRKSALSGVQEQRGDLNKHLGAEDRRRLDEYFTTLRGTEVRLEAQLQKPPPAPACNVPRSARGSQVAGMDVDVTDARHKLLADILVMALACNQTKVFNLIYSAGGNTTKKGEPKNHHVFTHEEPNGTSGYQEMHSWFVRRAMGAWAQLVGSLAAVKEGDRTLLDNTLIYAHSEVSTARNHATRGVPIMTAGRAGGRFKSGIHVTGNYEAPASEVGLTMLHAMGIESESWGVAGMKTSKTISATLA